MGIGRYWCCIGAVSSVLGCIGAAQTRTSLRRLSGSAPSPPLISTLHPPLRALISTLHPPLRALQRPKGWMEGGDRGRRYTARQRIHHNTLVIQRKYIMPEIHSDTPHRYSAIHGRYNRIKVAARSPPPPQYTLDTILTQPEYISNTAKYTAIQ